MTKKALICIVIKKEIFYLLVYRLFDAILLSHLQHVFIFFPSFISQNSSRLINHLNAQRILILFFIIIIGNSVGILSQLV